MNYKSIIVERHLPVIPAALYKQTLPKKFLTQAFLEGKKYDLGSQMWGSEELPHSCDPPLARRGPTIVGLIGS